MEEALNELRTELGEQRVDFAELVIAGAHAKVSELRRDGPAARRARTRLAAMVRERRVPVDIEAADEVKRLGLPA